LIKISFYGTYFCSFDPRDEAINTITKRLERGNGEGNRKKTEKRASSDKEDEIMRSEIAIDLFQFSIQVQSIGLFFTII
jgi:hypothetical protein